MRCAALIRVSALMLGAACGDPYLHTNPYDPAVPVEFVITGPDTLFSYGEIAHYDVRTIPAFPDTSFLWGIDTVRLPRPGMTDTLIPGEIVFRPSGEGGYVSIMPPLEPASVTIAVAALLGATDTTVAIYEGGTIQTSVYRHFGYKEVVLTQRLTRIQLRCPDAHLCDTLAVGGTWSVWADGFDALNHQIVTPVGGAANPKGGTPVVAYTVRDTNMATVVPNGIRVATVTARKPGTTWIVATRGALADSLQLVAR